MLSALLSILITVVEVVVVLFAILALYIKWNHQYWRKRNVPYLEPSFPMGHTNLPIFDKDPFGIQMKKLYDKVKAKGWKHCGIYLLENPNYLVVDLDYIRNIMTKDFQYFTDRGGFYNEEDDPLSAHLFAIGGIKWRNLRTKITPTFTSGKMKIMFQTLLDCEKPLIRAVDNCCKRGEALDIKDIFARFTTNIISACAFGLESDCFEEDDAPLRKYGKKLMDMPPLRAILVFFLLSYPNLARKLHMTFTQPEVSNFFMNVVKDTVNYREKNHVRRNDFLQMLIDMKSDDNEKHDGTKLTMNELAAQCFVFYIAGFETSSTTSTFLLYELAKHQDIQQKVRQEIEQVLARHGGQITYDVIHDLKYMDQVLDETLRKYPALPFLTRESVKDYKIPDTDIVLEKGTRVMIPIWGIHMDPEYYPDPEKFDPDRFNDENKRDRHPYAHLPFGEGPRNCIGMRFGLMQTKVGLAALIRNYKFTVSKRTKEPLQFQPGALVPTVDGDLWLDVQKIG